MWGSVFFLCGPKRTLNYANMWSACTTRIGRGLGSILTLALPDIGNFHPRPTLSWEDRSPRRLETKNDIKTDWRGFSWGLNSLTVWCLSWVNEWPWEVAYMTETCLNHVKYSHNVLAIHKFHVLIKLDHPWSQPCWPRNSPTSENHQYEC